MTMFLIGFGVALVAVQCYPPVALVGTFLVNQAKRLYSAIRG